MASIIYQHEHIRGIRQHNSYVYEEIFNISHILLL